MERVKVDYNRQLHEALADRPARSRENMRKLMEGIHLPSAPLELSSPRPLMGKEAVASKAAVKRNLKNQAATFSEPVRDSRLKDQEKPREYGCKERPKHNRPKGGKGSGKAFVPWC